MDNDEIPVEIIRFFDAEALPTRNWDFCTFLEISGKLNTTAASFLSNYNNFAPCRRKLIQRN
jgi:hypothetical protein